MPTATPRNCATPAPIRSLPAAPSARSQPSALSVQHSCESYIDRAARQVEDRASRQADQAAAQGLRLSGHRPPADRRNPGRRGAAGTGADLEHDKSDRIADSAVLEDVVNWAIHEGIRTDESNPWEMKRTAIRAAVRHSHGQSAPGAVVRTGAGVSRRGAPAERRQGQGDGVHPAVRHAHRRHRRRRQGPQRADAVGATSIGRQTWTSRYENVPAVRRRR